MLPKHVNDAIDHLAQWGAANARRPHYVTEEQVRIWIGGSIEAQITDPDYEQAEEIDS